MLSYDTHDGTVAMHIEKFEMKILFPKYWSTGNRD